MMDDMRPGRLKKLGSIYCISFNDVSAVFISTIVDQFPDSFVRPSRVSLHIVHIVH